MKQAGEHAIPPETMLTLPLQERIQAEVWGYNDEYKAPMSLADLSVELQSRGKDQPYQDKTETYAHTNDQWLEKYLERLIAQGLLEKSEDGGYMPVSNYKPPRKRT